MIRRFPSVVILVLIAIFPSPDHSAAQQPGGVFSRETWWSASDYWTWSVALGDVDGDGDLDLICGNSDELTGQPNTLYLNNGGIFAPTPAWRSDAANMTISVALGDIDGDGDLDLACGNVGNDSPERNEVYTNDGGIFGTTPSWVSDSPAFTTSIVLADIDNDNDLDLVCGSYETGNAVYLNVGGTLSLTPSWRSDAVEPTASIAVGDVNNDGYLDLACGNLGAPNTLYLNSGGTFGAAPSWEADSTYNTSSVVFGDIDGDGFLDLACCNRVDEFEGESYTLYMNQGGMLATTAAWIFPSTNAMWDIDLGDVDNDGDLDLVGRGSSVLTFLNEAGSFPATPSDSVAVSAASFLSGICLGDVDLDGRVDLVAGSVIGSTLHTNISPPFSTNPNKRWGWPWYGPASCLALGDIDGDDDIDMVSGNPTYDRTYLFRNTEGVLDTVPSWVSSEDVYHYWDIALSDVDGNGKLDVVTANQGSATLYLFEDGAFADIPAWKLDPMDAFITSVAFGDVDGNGDPDLVVGRSGGENTELYLNDSGVLSTVPAWESNPPIQWLHYTRAIALGDVNGDRKVDLVCGNAGEDGGGVNTLYLNQDGVFSTAPDWSSGSLEVAQSVALGDIDGDGNLDLVFGNIGAPSTLFLNKGGTFSKTPDWTSNSIEATLSIAISDVDGDGDLDLVCANTETNNVGKSNSIYLNEGGMFATDPAWISSTEYVTWAIGPGDIDKDGDVDLVFGGLQPVEHYFGRANPVFHGDPLNPTNQLPDNSAFVRSVGVQEAGENRLAIEAVTVDVESDPVWLVFDYQFEGQALWRPAVIVGHGSRVGPLSSSPGGVSHDFEWDVSTMPFDDREVILRVRTVSNPTGVSLIQRVPVYNKDVGVIEPTRPEITPSVDAIFFPSVTLGDTVLSDISISNTGNRVLTISDVSLPSTEMRLARDVPFDIAPGESVLLDLRVEPRAESDISGFVNIGSNDPITPVAVIGVETDIRVLQVTTNLLTTEPEIPLGDAVTVVVSPFPQVRVERGCLLHRPVGAAAFLDSIPLSKYGEDFIAVIPGEKVAEAGLEYYVRIENSGVFATDPTEAPDEYFTQAVQPPNSIASIPRPNTSLGFMEEIPIYVDVSLEQGTELVEGHIHFRRGGESAYSVAGPVSLEPSPVFVIPDSVAGPRGIEYWIEARTLTRTITDPATDPGRLPNTIRVTMRNLEEATTWAGKTYRMFSIPLGVIDYEKISLEALLSDQPEFGPYDPVQWRCFRYAAAAGRYVELSDQSAADQFHPAAGASFWLVSKDASRIGTAPTIGYSTSTDSSYAIALAPGWNMIGNPFHFAVAWDSMTVDGRPMAEAELTVINPPVGWTGRQYEYDAKTLEPWKGYWVKNLGDTEAVLRIPPKEAPLVVIASNAASPSREGRVLDSNEEWTIGIAATSIEARDGHNFIGVNAAALDEWDASDRLDAPMGPGESIALYFPQSAWEHNPDRYTVDIRAGSAPSIQGGLCSGTETGGKCGNVWSFDVAKDFSHGTAGDEVVLQFSGVESVPDEWRVLLVDRTLDRLVDLREEDRYTFFQGEREYVTTESAARFALLVGSEEFVNSHGEEIPGPPMRTVLHQNHPNPFNPSTIIQYELAQAGRVTLKIYDVSGALVKVLEDRDRQPGRYEIGWNADDERGNRVSSGVYFYRMETHGFTQTRKSVILK